MTSVAPLTAEVLQSLAIETGVVTSPIPVGSNLLAASTKHWAVNVHANRIVKITTGQGMGQTAIVLSNVRGGLIIRGAWLQPIAVGASYLILSVDIAQVLRDVLGGGANISAANPLEVHDPKVGSLISYEGVTTADGAGGGASLICAALAALPDYDGNQVIVTSGVCIGQARDIIGITTGGTVTPHLAFDAQILDGTHFVIAALRMVPAEVAALVALVGTAADAADLNTLFGRLRQGHFGVHAHVLLVVHDASALDADLDTALEQWLLDVGFHGVTIADPTDVAGNLEISAFDLVIVSASCVAADVGNLANLRTVEVPVICHSADIAASVVFSLGGTPHTEAAQTQIEITDNTPMWLITTALGDLTVTAAAAIYAMNTKCAAAVTIAEEATGTGNHLTIVRLLAGDDNGAVPAYAAFSDRDVFGVGDVTNMNAA